jgi:hypothetical protein
MGSPRPWASSRERAERRRQVGNMLRIARDIKTVNTFMEALVKIVVNLCRWWHRKVEMVGGQQ